MATGREQRCAIRPFSPILSLNRSARHSESTSKCIKLCLLTNYRVSTCSEMRAPRGDKLLAGRVVEFRVSFSSFCIFFLGSAGFEMFRSLQLTGEWEAGRSA